jgi:hypothetical protein
MNHYTPPEREESFDTPDGENLNVVREWKNATLQSYRPGMGSKNPEAKHCAMPGIEQHLAALRQEAPKPSLVQIFTAMQRTSFEQWQQSVLAWQQSLLQLSDPRQYTGNANPRHATSAAIHRPPDFLKCIDQCL